MWKMSHMSLSVIEAMESVELRCFPFWHVVLCDFVQELIPRCIHLLNPDPSIMFTGSAKS